MSSLKSKRSLRPPRPKNNLKAHQTSTRGDMDDDKRPQVQAYSGQLRGLMNNQEHFVFLHKNCNSYEKSLIETNANKDDVLVKHMMNLPDYLQRVDEGEYVQGKALNYGVLDWHRLEKWKGNNRVNPARSNNNNVNSSASGSGSARSGTVQRKQPHLVKEKSLSQDVKDSSVSAKRLDGQKRPHFKDKSRSRNYSSVKDGMVREKSSGQKSSVNKTLALEFSRNVLSNTTTEEVVGDQSVVLEDIVECSPQNNCPHTLQHSRAKSLCEGELEARKSDDFPDLVPFEGDIYMKKQHPKLQNSSHPYTTLALQRLSLDCEVSSNANVISNQGITNIESRRSNYVSHSDRFINGLSQLKRSLSFNQESYSSKQKSGKLTCEADPDVSSSQIPHSCPLLAGAEAMMDSNLRSYNSTDNSNMKLSKLSSQSDRFDLVSTELSFSKGGDHLLPDRSFSFRLRKHLSRSFNSRESFDITQYTQVKCGPVNSEKSDSLNKNGTASASRVKVSPLRRLLDPICKRKVAKPDKETTTNQAAAAASSSAAAEGASFQAVLEVVSSTNGFPMFKLLVNNGNNIIIAMKASNPPQKEDAPSSSCIYTLYAGQELKKNEKWMNQYDKGKRCGFGYNAVGHLKVYLPYSPRQIRLGEDQFTVRESVLYSIENGDAGKETPKLKAGRELAAIIVKEELKGFMDCNNSKTTVLLPEKVHSLPHKGGEPSPLIDRWRYGGSCDCGGWDVGCQLQILTNEDHQNSGSSTDCFITDHLHLFHQGGEVKELEEKKPMFSLAKYKEGTYMVEFSGSISSLQACSICITAVANQIPFCDDDSISSLNNSGHIFKGDEEPIKYVSFPPASPVERV